MHERFALHIEEGLGRLARRIERARRKLDRGPLERQIGRLLERNSRSAGRYLAILALDQNLPAGLRLEWSIRPEREDLSRFSEGCYVLRPKRPPFDTRNCRKSITVLSDPLNNCPLTRKRRLFKRVPFVTR